MLNGSYEKDRKGGNLQEGFNDVHLYGTTYNEFLFSFQWKFYILKKENKKNPFL